MGVCFSKKKKDPAAPPNPTSNSPNIPIPKERKNNKNVAAVNEETKREAKSPQQAASSSSVVAAPVEKKPIFVITQNLKKTPSSSEEEKPKKSDPELSIKNTAETVRTSSCTKDEVDAILIQCGRLSRSSSAKAASNDRKYSGSKRSYDFDNDKSRDNEEENWDDQKQQQISRPSPRRRTPNRERSGSRERGSQRRVSRSPVRRFEGPAVNSSSSGSCDKPKQQPAKMVSVPAREKGVSNIAANVETAGVKRASTAVVNKRNASPRSRSPANTTRVSNENAPVHQAAQPQSLSRSSSKKQEQSPFRRNPMTEIDDNCIRGNNGINANKAQKSREGEEPGVRKASQVQTQKNGGAIDVITGAKSSKNNTTTITNCVRDQLMSCRAKEKQPEPETVEEAKEIESLNNRKLTRSRSSRRSSRDLDNLNVATYTSLLLEDIQNYHQQNVGFSLPACVSKACSILEAVADLNSSSSDQSNNDNGRFGGRGLTPDEPFMESEVVVKDDLMEPSLHKYISMREMEPQESAGSNSFVGQPSWELNSVDSTDRYWTSQSNHEEEVEAVLDLDARGTRFRSGGSSSNSLPSATGSSSKKRDLSHRSSGGSGKGGSRAYSVPVAAATS